MKVAIIGGGVSGCMAAAKAAEHGHETYIFEKNDKLLKKMFISGKGRCNVTNCIDLQDFLEQVVNNGKFLYSAMKEFDCYSTMSFFEDIGVPLKVEHGGRVFPKSDKSSDITKAFEKYVRGSGVNVLINTNVTDIKYNDNKFFINNLQRFDCVVIACGGASYPLTGSTGDGYAFAKRFGHSVVDIKPALVGVYTKEEYVKELCGLTLKNINLTCYSGDKQIFSRFGELLFTHQGISGPVVLSMSSYINRLDLKNVFVKIDLKPALSKEQLDKRIQADFQKNINKAYKNSLNDLLPKSLIPIIVNLSGIDENIAVNQISAINRSNLVDTLKGMTLHISGLRDIKEAIITSGGVNVSQINPKTMQSKLVKGLYFTGEVLDIDALTGGYNIQIALSTGHSAGSYIGE